MDIQLSDEEAKLLKNCIEERIRHLDTEVDTDFSQGTGFSESVRAAVEEANKLTAIVERLGSQRPPVGAGVVCSVMGSIDPEP